MTFNAKIRDFIDFFVDFGLRDISRTNCANINWDRHGQAAYEIFSIERRFQMSKSRFSRFEETCGQGHQRAVPS